ncbi:MAG: hypothetical protein ACYS1C_09335, partial [Planctomycetota bacterium]
MSTTPPTDGSRSAPRPGIFTRLLALVGVRLREERDQWLVLTRRFPFVVLGLGVVGVGAASWFIYFTSQPRFCEMCHYIRPYVA